MMMLNVVVVPETEDYEFHVSHENKVWITKRLGVPRLEDNDARYLAPYWLKNGIGVTRVFHITKSVVLDDSTELSLGNSFVLEKPWNGIGQPRRFEYHSLLELGFVEICEGLLTKL